MTISIPIHGGGAQPVSSDTSGKTIGRVALRAYGFPSEAAAIAASYRSEAGPAMSVYVVSAAQLASGAFVLDGDPKALPVYAAPAGMKVEGGYSQPIYVAGGSLGGVTPVQTYTQKVQALGPIAYWPLNEPVGTTGAGSVLDASGHGRTATPTNATFGVTGIGDGSTACSLAGTGGITANTIWMPSAAGSLLLWLACDMDSVTAFDLFSDIPGGSDYIFGVKDAVRRITVFYRGNSVTTSLASNGNTGTAWRSLVMTWAVPGNLNLYINGTPVAPAAITDVITAHKELSIGWQVGYGNLVGSLAHLAIFGYELSSAQVLNIANP
jgi:hypothetical protein